MGRTQQNSADLEGKKSLKITLVLKNIRNCNLKSVI